MERVIAVDKISLNGRSAVNTEPAIRNGYLPYPWGLHWREGELDARSGGVSGVKHCEH